MNHEQITIKYNNIKKINFKFFCYHCPFFENSEMSLLTEVLYNDFNAGNAQLCDCLGGKYITQIYLKNPWNPGSKFHQLLTYPVTRSGLGALTLLSARLRFVRGRIVPQPKYFHLPFSLRKIKQRDYRQKKTTWDR